MLRLPVFSLAWLLALFCIACRPDVQIGAPEEERRAPARIEGGHVIVVAPPEDAASMSDEAYADWATRDPIHFDAFIDPYREDFSMLYYFNQRSIQQQHPLDTALTRR